MQLSLPQSVKLGSVVVEIHLHDPVATIVEETRAKTNSIVVKADELLKAANAYQLSELVGQGGMAVVHKAEDLKLQRPVAMKRMLRGGVASNESRQRFIQEARVMGGLEHPNVVPIYELGLDAGGQVFYTMKLIKGVTFHEVLAEIKAGKAGSIARYPLSQLLTIFQKVCDAVSFAHSKGVIHRDLKPQNIMLGDFGEVMVMDWGLAKILESASSPSSVISPSGPLDSRTKDNAEKEDGKQPDPSAIHTIEGRVMGSPNFMAPEQAAGRISEIGPATDIYALGGILYNILTLRPPVASADLKTMLELIRTGEIRPPTEYNELRQRPGKGSVDPSSELHHFPHCPGGKVPQPLSAIAMKALATRPADRYAYMAAFQKDIAAYQSGFATSAEVASQWRVASLWFARHKVVFATLTGIAALITVFSAFSLNMWLELRGTAETFYEKSQALVAANKFEEALTPIGYAIRLDGKKADYHSLRGNILESLLELKEARTAYEETLRLQPDHHGFLFHNLKLRCLSQVSPSSKWSATFSKMTGRGSLIGSAR